MFISEHVQTCTDSSVKESDQERQRKAKEVADLRKQLSKAASEACLHWHFGFFSLCEKHCTARVVGYRYGKKQALIKEQRSELDRMQKVSNEVLKNLTKEAIRVLPSHLLA